MARKVMPKRYEILVIGCGGTGSAFLQNIVPYIIHRSPESPAVRLILCDGDIVEEKNLARQVFFPDQIGMNKALALQESIDSTFELKAQVVDHYLETVSSIDAVFENRYMCMPVLVSCVDNLKTRSIFEEWFNQTKDAVYIDCANEEYHGEVVYSTRFGGELLSPTRSTVFPLFRAQLKAEAESLKFRSEMDCLSRAMMGGAQHIFTNKMAGLLAASTVSRMLETNTPPSGVDLFRLRPSTIVQHEETSSMLALLNAPKAKNASSKHKKAG